MKRFIEQEAQEKAEEIKIKVGGWAESGVREVVREWGGVMKEPLGGGGGGGLRIVLLCYTLGSVLCRLVIWRVFLAVLHVAAIELLH